MEKKDRSTELCLTTLFKVKKVLGKTTSKIFKSVKEGDIIKISLPLVNNSGFRGAKQVYATVSKINDNSEGEELGNCSMKALHTYLNQTESRYFELEELDSELFDRVKNYCEHYCLTGRDEDLCKTCPLSCQLKIY